MVQAPACAEAESCVWRQPGAGRLHLSCELGAESAKLPRTHPQPPPPPEAHTGANASILRIESRCTVFTPLHMKQSDSDPLRMRVPAAYTRCASLAVLHTSFARLVNSVSLAGRSCPCRPGSSILTCSDPMCKPLLDDTQADTQNEVVPSA